MTDEFHDLMAKKHREEQEVTYRLTVITGNQQNDIKVERIGFNKIMITQGNNYINTSPERILSAVKGIYWLDKQEQNDK